MSDTGGKTTNGETDLTFVGFGEPTSNGMTYVYSTELAAKLRQPPVKKGTNNRGTFGLANAPPWAPQVRDGKHNQPFHSVSREDYGTAAERSRRGDAYLNSAEELKARNQAMKKRQREGAVRRQQVLFEYDVKQHNERMAEEKARYDRAQADFLNRSSKTFTHKGVHQRSQLTELELHRQRLDEIAAKEDRMRQGVPRIKASTPEPRLDMLLAQKELDMSAMPVPLRALSVAGTTAGIKGEAETHVYPADRQRMKFNMLEAARLAAGKSDLVESGWKPQTDPRGNDKVRPKSADAVKFDSMDPDARERLERAMVARNEELAWRKEREVRRQQAFDEKVRRDEEEARRAAGEIARAARGGVDAEPTAGNRFNQLAKRYDSLLNEVSGATPFGTIRVPKDMGIVKATTKEEMAAKEAQLLKLLEMKRDEAKAQVPAGRTSGVENNQGGAAALLYQEPQQQHAKRLPFRNNPTDTLNVNLLAEIEKSGVAALEPLVAGRAAGGGDGAKQQSPVGRRHMHSPSVRALGGPRRIVQPTRKDIDRELHTVRDGGHLRKQHVPLLKTLPPEAIQAIKAYPRGGGAAMSPAPAPKAPSLLM